MSRLQIKKILKITLIATLFLLFFEILFSFKEVTDYVSSLVSNHDSKLIIYIIVFLLMYIQVCFIPIPGYIILAASVHAKIILPENGVFNMLGTPDFWLYILIVMVAYMAGAVTAYLIGKIFGRKAVVWCAGSEDDYGKWCEVINSKGKFFYFLTIIFPFFPDDLLCIIAGTIRFPFKYYFFANLFGRLIGLVTMLVVLALIQNLNKDGINWSLILWIVILVIQIIYYIINDIKNRKSLIKE